MGGYVLAFFYVFYFSKKGSITSATSTLLGLLEGWLGYSPTFQHFLYEVIALKIEPMQLYLAAWDLAIALDNYPYFMIFMYDNTVDVDIDNLTQHDCGKHEILNWIDMLSYM
jgi:hypothetical protein